MLEGRQCCSAAEHAQAERTRDALMEYLFLALFIASSVAESESSKAADRWTSPTCPIAAEALQVLRLSHVSLCFLSGPCPASALYFIILPQLPGIL